MFLSKDEQKVLYCCKILWISFFYLSQDDLKEALTTVSLLVC